MANLNNVNKFRQRFVKDYNLPINVFSDELFSYYFNLYDFFPVERYKNHVTLVETLFDGNVDKWLEYCAKVRDNAINGVMETEAYQKFNTMDLSEYNFTSPCGERSCYTEETDGKRFISIDLKKANFQALKYVGVLTDNTYSDFIRRFGGDDYIINSKYLRQVIFGKMNPSRQIKIEKYLMWKIYNIVKEMDKFSESYKLFSMNSDEIILEEVKNKADSMAEMYLSVPMLGLRRADKVEAITKEIAKHMPDIEVKVEYIEVRRLPIVSSNGTKIDAYERVNLNTGETVLKKASTTFYPQIYKLWKGMPIEKNDMVFYFENQLATFNEPIKREENDI